MPTDKRAPRRPAPAAASAAAATRSSARATRASPAATRTAGSPLANAAASPSRRPACASAASAASGVCAARALGACPLTGCLRREPVQRQPPAGTCKGAARPRHHLASTVHSLKLRTLQLCSCLASRQGHRSIGAVSRRSCSGARAPPACPGPSRRSQAASAMRLTWLRRACCLERTTQTPRMHQKRSAWLAARPAQRGAAQRAGGAHRRVRAERVQPDAPIEEQRRQVVAGLAAAQAAGRRVRRHGLRVQPRGLRRRRRRGRLPGP